MSHRHILLPLAALFVAACSDSSLTDSLGSVDIDVASITLPADSLTLDMRSTAPQTIRYSIVNAAGESLCGRVPVSVQADTAAFTAQLSPADPCLITLTPRAERSGWLRLQAGAKQVSTPVSVYRRRYRWAFDLPSGTHVVGTTVQATFTVWGDNDKPMAGMPVHFEEGSLFSLSVGEKWYWDAGTDANGIARVSITLPRRTQYEQLGPQLTETHPLYRIWAQASMSEARAETGITLVPDAPHHIGVYKYIDMFSERCPQENSCYLTDSWAHYVTVRDTVTLRSYDDWNSVYFPSGGCPPFDDNCFPTLLWMDHYYNMETLAATIEDQYGNPTSNVPDVVAGRVVAVHGFTTVGRFPCCLWTAWYGGRVGEIDWSSHDRSPVTLTFTAPGLASTSIIAR